MLKTKENTMKKIEGFENYSVTEDGKIYNNKFNRLLKHAIVDGYHKVGLFNKAEGIYNMKKLVHRLVAEAYIPNPDNKETVNHIDGDKSNNHVSNLEWATRSENVQHAYSNGLKHGIHKHNHFTRRKIAAMYDTGKYTQPELGKMFGVSYVTIASYINEFKPKRK